MAQQLTAVVSNEVQMAILGVATAKPQIDSGRLAPLAILGTPVTALPGVPEIRKFIPGYADASSWQGFLAPSGTPRAVVERLSTYFSELVRGEMRDYFENQGYIVIGDTPDEMQTVRLEEVKKWRSLLRETGIKLDF